MDSSVTFFFFFFSNFIFFLFEKSTYTPQEAAELDMMEGKYLSGGQNDPGLFLFFK